MKKLLALVLTLSLLCCYAIPCAYAENTATGDFFETEPVEEDLLSEEPAEELPAGSGVEIENATAEEALIGDVTAEEIQPELPEEEIDVIPKIKYQREALVLKALGIMETDDYNQTVTRAEFVASVVTLCGYSNEASVATAYFSDVPEGHEYEGAIAYASGIKLVQGDGSKFRPDEPVTAEEAGIILLRALGHDNFSPYVTVDIVKARREGIYDGVSEAGNKPLTFDVATKLIYNAMNLEMILVRGTTSDGLGSALVLEKNGTTLLNYYRKLYMKEGRLTDNGFTTYSSESSLSDKLIKIDNLVLEKGSVDVSDLLGHKVEAYYDENDVLLHISDITEEKSIIYIPAERIISASLGNLQYETETGKAKSVSFLANANIVYNGKALKKDEFTQDLLKPALGGIKLVRTSDKDYDLVVIKSQFNCVVKTIHQNNGVYLFTDVDSSVKNVTVDVDDINSTVFIYDKNGNPFLYSDITGMNVLTVAKSLDGKLLDIRVNTEKDKGIISSINSTDRTIVIEDIRYKLSYDADTSGVKVGSFGWYYLDIYGNIAYFNSFAFYEERYGYLMKVWLTDDDGDVIHAKIFDESGQIIICSAKNKITADGAILKSSGFGSFIETFYSGTDFVPCIVRFKLDLEGNLASIDTYQTRETHDSLRVIDAPKTMDNENKSIFIGKRRYMSGSKQFDGNLMVSSDTLVFGIPVGPHNDDDFVMLDLSYFVNNRYYDVEMYTTNGDSPVAQAMIVRYAAKYDETNVNSKGYVIYPSVYPCMMDTGLVTDVQLVVDENQDVNTVVTFTKLKDAKTYKYPLKWDDLGPFKVGDVIRYYVINEKIIDAELIFDCNTLTAGTPRMIYSNIDTFVVRNNGREMADSTKSAEQTPIVNTAWCLSYLDVYSIHDGVITGVAGDASSSNDEGDVRRFALNTLPAGIWKYDSISKKLVSSSLNNIATYENAQSDCTKVLIMSQNASAVGLVILD